MTVDWRYVLPETERAIYAAAGYGGVIAPAGPVATLVIDVTYGFVGQSELSDQANRNRYPNWCGPTARSAIGPMTALIAESVKLDRPVVQTVDVSTGDPNGIWSAKRDRIRDKAPDESTLLPEVAINNAHVIEKGAPSAFFRTGLEGYLNARGITDLLVAGGTTSGCVRASVVDAFSQGFNVFVIEDAVFDRAPTSHSVSLYEMNQKYASVINTPKSIEIVRGSVVPRCQS